MARSDAQPESNASTIAAAHTDFVCLAYLKEFIALAASSEPARITGYRRLNGVDAGESIRRAGKNTGGSHKLADLTLQVTERISRAVIEDLRLE